ncbi:MAG TPA: hypothetical protein VLV78_08770 [Thermoanaerobaculia bacterium]|nr:hypothetical protein [Thermoanaerobaculia bacterium]
MSERAVVRLLIAVTIVAAAVRMLSVIGLHPLNWDEIEFFRATDWVRQGLTPYRDFWEHHTPLQWYLFAPFAAMTKSPGAAAIVWMRIVQVPLWIATFWLTNVWMRRSGLTAFGRWTAIALATCSSLLMIAAVEYRVDVLGCAVYVAALVVLSVERRPSPAAGDAPGRASLHAFLAGVLLCLTGFANLRLGPLLALTVLLDAIMDRREHRWRFNRRVLWVITGVIVTFVLVLGYFAARGALRDIYQHVWYENYLGDKFADRVPWAFVHRMLIAFGIRIYGGGDFFEWSGIDIAGVALIVLGLIGLARALARWRRPDEWLFFAILQIANMLFIAKMKFVYNYHLEIVVLMMLPFIAGEVERWKPLRTVAVFAVVAMIISAGLVIFRGKEQDFAYQDLIMREAQSHTRPGSKVFDGVGWALRRNPAYRFWFLPDLIRQLIAHGYAPPYRVADWVVDPPAAVITDRNAAVWLAQHPDLGSMVVRHYLPLWRNLWLPALSARLEPGHAVAEWYGPVDGDYRLVASLALAEHPWFAHPLAYRVSEPTELHADHPSAIADVIWYVNRRPAAPVRGVLRLRKGDVVNAVSMMGEPVGIFLVPGSEPVWFRQPPLGVTLDSEAPRVTHVPDLRLAVSHGLRFD